MPQRQEPCLNGLEALEPLSVAMILARQSERQLALPRRYRESSCLSSPGRRPVQLPSPTPITRRPPPRFAPEDAAEILVGGEWLFSTGSRIDRTMHVGAQFSPDIDGSSPLQPASLLDAAQGRDATSGLATRARALETLKTLDRAGAPQRKVVRR